MTIQEETNPPATSQNQVSPARGWLGVAAITASLFVFLTTELMPIGLLTPLSESLNVSVGAAGLMVTAQGIAAGLGVPFIVAWSRRVNRRKLLVTLLAVLAIGNLITSIAPNYPLILGTRLIMGFASGVFWAIGVTMAMRIVPEKHANRAAAVVMSGISIATVVGIPLGTLLESASDWRTTFLIWSALSAVVFIAVAVTVPSLPSANAVSVREVFTLPLKNVQLRVVLIMVVFFVLGHFGAYTFVRPYLEESTSATVGFITVVLIVFGIGGAVGNFIGGHTVNKSLRGSFIVGGLIMVASLVLLLTIGANKVGVIIAMTLWGLAFGVVQLSQINMTLSAAPQQFEAAMSLNTMAYNTCIALGALIGGLFADHVGVSSVVWFGIVLVALAVILRSVTGRGTAPAS
ncbi:MFS transporter [Streptomyces microflavus]|uniref:MFS transporter n=2 Tax=Streptomyces microflavus TaxID=1919 RepID=A0A7J0CZT7_STRMI|nr:MULTISPECIES: MFS transporter [Streptomyces]AGK80828.1 Major facilitator transporter [Streptomyces microflavus DSM 40593]MCX4655905.1 MFS transporter [Streptomyces microflavus]MDX2979124.1 MFS transporter [Streptomyces sp. NRRL_B-2249]WSA63985.1 MFS transporter [Streptomyces microflavus]WSS33347.1 MFS transporter [Streptomyces microflavus]